MLTNLKVFFQNLISCSFLILLFVFAFKSFAGGGAEKCAYLQNHVAHTDNDFKHRKVLECVKEGSSNCSAQEPRKNRQKRKGSGQN